MKKGMILEKNVKSACKVLSTIDDRLKPKGVSEGVFTLKKCVLG
jgi:uncharacterized protein HemX